MPIPVIINYEVVGKEISLSRKEVHHILNYLFIFSRNVHVWYIMKFKEEIDIDGAFLVKLKVALHLGND